jgi:hypothetical protein
LRWSLGSIVHERSRKSEIYQDRLTVEAFEGFEGWTEGELEAVLSAKPRGPWDTPDVVPQVRFRLVPASPFIPKPDRSKLSSIFPRERHVCCCRLKRFLLDIASQWSSDKSETALRSYAHSNYHSPYEQYVQFPLTERFLVRIGLTRYLVARVHARSAARSLPPELSRRAPVRY